MLVQVAALVEFVVNVVVTATAAPITTTFWIWMWIDIFGSSMTWKYYGPQV